MDVQYGIAVSNKFSLFGSDDDADPFEILRQQEENSKKQKEEGGSGKAKTKKTKKTPPASSTEPKGKAVEPVAHKTDGEKPGSRQGNERVRSARPPREIRENDGDRRPPRRQGPREPRENRTGDENVPPEFRERPEGSAGFRSEDRERGRGRGRGRGGERGRGRGRGGFGGFEGRGRREFDRHSGSDRTGIKPVNKKDGGGSHNWGTIKDDMEEENWETTVREEMWETSVGDVPREQTTEEEPRETPENAVPTGEGGEGEGVPEEDKGPKEMTLDEWKAMQKESKVKKDFNVRKAGEGVDLSQWKKGVAYKKKQEEEDEDDEEDDDEEDDRPTHPKNIVNIPITFNDSMRRGRGSRRPRGNTMRGGRPNTGRGGNTGGPPPAAATKVRESAPRMDDENFPSLMKTEA